MANSNFLHSLHWFRGIAIIFVVMGHTVTLLNSDDILSISLTSFFVNGTLFFVFIAGYLFWHLKDRYEYKKYLVNKFKYVVLPYTFLLGAVILLVFFLEQKGIYIGSKEYAISFSNPFEINHGFLWHYFVGGAIVIPYWFLPFIFIVFLTSIVIFKISNSRYFMPFFIIFILVSLFTFRPTVEESPILFPLLNYFYFLGIFLLGIFMKKNETIFFNKAKSLTFIFLFLFLFAQVFFIFGQINDLNFIKMINMSQLKMVFGVIFFVSLLFLIEKNMDGKSNSNIFLFLLDILAKYSFAIFFLHMFALKAMKVIVNKYFAGFDNPLGFLVLILGTFVISMAITWIVKKLLGKKSRMLIGS